MVGFRPRAYKFVHSFVVPNRNVMFWTEEHDKLMCREILAVDPFSGMKKGTVQRGSKWKVIENLTAIETPTFKVDTRSVRDRYNLLSQKLRKKLKEEEKASGIDTEMSEVETALEEIIEKEDASEEAQGCESEGKRKRREQDRENTQNIRRKAMEQLGKTQVKEGGKRKRRSNSSNTFVYLREKNEILQEMRKEELDLKKKETEQQDKKTW